mmetsp:Transcript_35460/g.89325  ORF Transcript_35460/g.89325 Transcript_35460/m.89325 type:complete len:209 (-) Transcript_35460:250-876(-)
MLGILGVVRELLHDLLVGMLCVQLLLLKLILLGTELVLQLLQHFDNAAGLELVAIGFGRAVEKVLVRHLLDTRLRLLQEGSQGLLGGEGDHLQLLDLKQRMPHLYQLGLLPVVGLLLEHSNGLSQCFQRLSVVLLRGREVCTLLLANVRSRRLVLLPPADILVELRNAVRKPSDLGIRLLDLGAEHLHALCSGLDLRRLDTLLIIAPL